MKTNEELFRAIIEIGFGKGDRTVIDQLAAPDFVEHRYGFVPPDASGASAPSKRFIRRLRNFSLTVEDLVSAGDKVWGRMTARGTQQGQPGPMPPTGRRIEVTVIDIMRFKDGKLAEHRGVPDRFAMMEQLGMKPPPRVVMKLLSLLHR